jgi:salicylate hydroxylase
MPGAGESVCLVIGAGIGGLAAALALQRAHQRVCVFEQSTTLGEVGAGLSITPNAGRALIALGLREQLESIGSTPSAGALKHYQTGATLVTLAQDESRAKHGVPLYHVHRADLHRALADAVRSNDSAAICLGKALTSIEDSGAAVRAQFADGTLADGDWLVGCDGIRSVARVALFGTDRANFTGFVAWRGLVDVNAIPPAQRDPPLCMTVGPGRMLMRYPLRRGSLVNVVAVGRRAAWTEEGWSVPADRDELLDEFADFEQSSRTLLHAIPAERCFKWGLFDRDPLPSWTRGRCTLLGDAAHPMPPFAGQGAVMALEDAVVLGRAAAAGSSPAEACRRYESARIERVTHVLRMSRARAALYFADDPAAQVRALDEGMAELRTLYGYDAATVPVS